MAEDAPEPPWRLAGEVLNTYIIVERGEMVYLIDKHAAHERMNFDRMKAEGYTPMSQTLLTPAICRLSPGQRDALLGQRELQPRAAQWASPGWGACRRCHAHGLQ